MHLSKQPRATLIWALSVQGDKFLRQLKLRWDNHQKSMQMIRDILMVRRSNASAALPLGPCLLPLLPSVAHLSSSIMT